MEDKKEKEYPVPSNVKRGITWLGLDFRGWIYFIFTLAVFVGLALLIPSIKARVTVILAAILIGHWSYQIDQKTGAMNGAIVGDVIMWILSPKVDKPVWGEDVDRETRIIRVEEE